MIRQSNKQIEAWLDQTYKIGSNGQVITNREAAAGLNRDGRRYLEKQLKKGKKVKLDDVMHSISLR